MWTFSSCGERGYSLVAVQGLLIVVASREARALGTQASVVRLTGSVVVVHGLSCPIAYGILVDQGEPISSALASGFLATGPPGKSKEKSLIF